MVVLVVVGVSGGGLVSCLVRMAEMEDILWGFVEERENGVVEKVVLLLLPLLL